MQKSGRPTYESRRSHHLREWACAPDRIILFVMENDSGRRFPPAPKCGSAFTPTLTTTPAAFACGYLHVAWRKRVPLRTQGGTLRLFLAAVPGRPWASLKHTTPLEWCQSAPTTFEVIDSISVSGYREQCAAIHFEARIDRLAFLSNHRIFT